MDLKICRICGGTNQLKNILGEEMRSKLLICFNITVNPVDFFPQLICEQCDRNLDIFYRLRKQSESTQERLMIEMQRKQNVHTSGSVNEVQDGSNEDIFSSSECDKIDLVSQYSEDSFESMKMDPNISKEICSPKTNRNEQLEIVNNDEYFNLSQRSEYNNGEKYQCNQCFKIFPTWFRLKRHEQIHNENATFKCYYCNQSFRDFNNMTRHMRAAHLSKKSFECMFCSKTFTRTEFLRYHLKVYCKEKMLQSSLIPQSVANTINAQEKIQTAVLEEKGIPHQNNGSQYVCHICEAIFYKKDHLKAHIHTHTKSKSFKCADCSAEFSFLHLLERHTRKALCRSINQVYTTNDDNETSEVIDNDALQAEINKYIVTGAALNNDEFDENYMDMVGNNEDIRGSSPTELEIIEAEQPFLMVNKCAASDHSPRENIIDQIYENENHVKDQIVDILVAEETKLTSSVYNAYRIE